MSSFKEKDFEEIFKSYLKIETYSTSIDSLFSERMLNKINYKPYYQRNYVWDHHKATYFIESILLGTEIPPLIFFNSGDKIEVIDGRQRFETIYRFRRNQITLTTKGLLNLRDLARKTYNQLGTEPLMVKDLFDEANIRVFEFKVVKEGISIELEDEIKKEIFRRYNSGITPLKNVEIDNAKYDDDDLSTFLKEKIKKDIQLKTNLIDIFFPKARKEVKDEDILNFIRKILALSIYPIKYYARSSERTLLTEKAYEYYVNNEVEGLTNFYENLITKINLINDLKKYLTQSNLQFNWLIFETLLWQLFILEKEETFDYAELRTQSFYKNFGQYVSENIHKYNENEYHYYKDTMERYACTCDYFRVNYNLEGINIRVLGDLESTQQIKELKKAGETKNQLSELENLRITKPQPSRKSIDDIIRLMGKSRFIVRPSYQRAEVINSTKASGIIESILLGIPLPAIFIYKKNDNISEVIDGQQRLLTILGFLGTDYMSENGKSVTPKNHNFSLRKLRILNELNSSTFDALDVKLKDKILDFGLSVVEIEEKLNPNFNPVDLFIRLNDKPYPILENSFEMWNSWVDFEVIKKIKSNLSSHEKWFYIRYLLDDTGDRMENEELYTSLVFLEYNKLYPTKDRKFIEKYQKNEKTNIRIPKVAITYLLKEVSENEETKKKLYEAINQTEVFISNLRELLEIDNEKNILSDSDKKKAFDEFFNPINKRYFRRTLQDFYFLWLILNEFDVKVIRENKKELKIDIINIFKSIKQGKSSIESFDSLITDLKKKYRL